MSHSEELELVTRERDDAIARAREYARAIMEVHIARCSGAVDAIRGHAPECQANGILPRDREQALRDVEACRDALRKAALESP